MIDLGRAWVPSVSSMAAVACAWALPAFAQSPSADADRKHAKAVRVNSADSKLDGRLDEAIWSSAPALSDFTQKDPNEGAPASDPVEVRILYDDAGLYVGARMTGAGWGGACVALCQAGMQEDVARAVLPAYAASGGRGRALVPEFEDKSGR